MQSQFEQTSEMAQIKYTSKSFINSRSQTALVEDSFQCDYGMYQALGFPFHFNLFFFCGAEILEGVVGMRSGQRRQLKVFRERETQQLWSVAIEMAELFSWDLPKVISSPHQTPASSEIIFRVETTRSKTYRCPCREDWWTQYAPVSGASTAWHWLFNVKALPCGADLEGPDVEAQDSSQLRHANRTFSMRLLQCHQGWS